MIVESKGPESPKILTLQYDANHSRRQSLDTRDSQQAALEFVPEAVNHEPIVQVIHG